MVSRYILVIIFWFVAVANQQGSFPDQNAQQPPEVCRGHIFFILLV